MQGEGFHATAQTGADQQPRRDRHSRGEGGFGAWHGVCRRLRAGGRALAAHSIRYRCAGDRQRCRARRGGRVFGRRGAGFSRHGNRLRQRPPGLRLSGRERGFRRALRGRRVDVRGAASSRFGPVRGQDAGAGLGPNVGCAGGAGQRRAARRRRGSRRGCRGHRLSGNAEGRRRWRRARHEGGGVRWSDGRGVRTLPRRSPGGLRRHRAVRRKTHCSPPAHRGADTRGRARQRGASARARLLSAAAQPEGGGDRAGAGIGRRVARAVARGRGEVGGSGGLRQRRYRGVPGGAGDRRALLHRMQSAHSSGAHRHRRDHRRGLGGGAIPHRRRRQLGFPWHGRSTSRGRAARFRGADAGGGRAAPAP